MVLVFRVSTVTENRSYMLHLQIKCCLIIYALEFADMTRHLHQHSEKLEARALYVKKMMDVQFNLDYGH